MEEGAVMMTGLDLAARARGARDPRDASRAAPTALLRIVADYDVPERLREGRADHPELHGLREPCRLAEELTNP